MTDQEMGLMLARGGVLHIIERAKRASELIVALYKPGYKPRRQHCVPDAQSVEELLTDIESLVADVRRRLLVAMPAREG